MGLFDGIIRVVTGNVAHDAADSGNPLKVGGKASTSAPTAVANGDRVDQWFDEFGRPWVSTATRYGWAHYNGFGSGTVDGTARADIVFQRASSPTYPLTDVLTSGAEVLDYFDTDDALFDDTPIFFYVPLAEAGYRTCTVIVRNQTGVNLSLIAYQVPGNINLTSVGPLSSSAFKNPGPVTDTPYTIATTGFFYIGIGTDDDDSDANRITSKWVSGGLLVRVTPASDPPGGGSWLVTIMRGA